MPIDSIYCLNVAQGYISVVIRYWICSEEAIATPAINFSLGAVLDDIQSERLLSGARSLGIIHKFITGPFMSLVESTDVHILDLGDIVKSLIEDLVQWSFYLARW